MKRLQHKIPPPIITLVIALMMWGLHLLLPIRSVNFSILFYFGILCILAGLSLDIVSFLDFRKSDTTVNPLSPERATSLVIEGFYRFTRNPMYLGMLLILIGIAMLFASLSSFILLPIFVVLMNSLQIIPEEQALEKIFSQEYLDYKKKVRRWI